VAGRPRRGSTAPSRGDRRQASEAGSTQMDWSVRGAHVPAHRRGRLAAGRRIPTRCATVGDALDFWRAGSGGEPGRLLRLRAEMKCPAWLGSCSSRAPPTRRPILGPADGLLRAARARRAPVLVRPLPHPLGDLFRADQSHLGTRGGGAASTGRGITLGPGHVTVTADQAGAIPARRCSMALPSAPVSGTREAQSTLATKLERSRYEYAPVNMPRGCASVSPPPGPRAPNPPRLGGRRRAPRTASRGHLQEQQPGP